MSDFFPKRNFQLSTDSLGARFEKGVKCQFDLPLSFPDRMYDPKVVHYVIMLIYAN